MSTTYASNPHRSGTGLLLSALLVLALPPGLAGQEAVESLILSPDPGETVPQNQFVLAVSFVDPAGTLDPESIQLQVDGTDVTARATVTPQVITWTPETPLPPGRYRANVSARDRSGSALPPVNWSFTVTSVDTGVEEARELPAAPSSAGLSAWAPTQGSVIFENTTAAVSGPGADLRRDEDFLPRLWVNATGAIRPGWRYSTRIHLSGYESSERQPVNRYRVDLRAPNATVSFGDVNPQLQGLILRGRRVRGLEAEVRGGPLALGFVAGQARRSIDGMLDPVDPTRVYRTGTYGRSVYAVRPAVGTGDRFQFGLTAMRARDDEGSISELRTDPDGTGSTRSATPLPKDNLVLGADVTSRLIDGRILVQYENALSFFANDITGGPITKTQLDSILNEQGYDPVGIDPERWERFFTINASAIPLDLTGRTNVAHRLRTSVRAGSHFISAEFQSVGGSYYSLGHPGLQRDRRGVRLRDSFTMLDHAMAVSIGVEQDRDNLDGMRMATTTSRGIFADANWQEAPDRPGLSASLRLGSRANDLPTGEDGALDETNWTMGAGFVLPVRLLDGYRTRVTGNWSLMNRDDPANPLVGSRNSYYLGGFQGETLDRRTEFRILYGLNRSELTEFDEATTNFHRLSLGGRHLVAPRWTALVDGTLTRARGPDSDDPDTLALGLRYDRNELMIGGEFEWTSSSYVSFEAGVVQYSDALNPDRDTREILTRIRINRPF